MGREEYPDNPFVSGAEAFGVVQLVVANFQVMSATWRLDRELACAHAQMVGYAGTYLSGGKPSTGLMACLFELACLARGIAVDSGYVPRVSSDACADPECDGNCQEQSAFFDACTRGDFEAAVNVTKAAFKRGAQEDTPDDDGGESRLARIYAGGLYALAASLYVSRPDDPPDHTDN